MQQKKETPTQLFFWGFFIAASDSSNVASLQRFLHSLKTAFCQIPYFTYFQWDRRQISLRVLSEYKRINQLLFSLKSLGNLGLLMISGGIELN